MLKTGTFGAPFSNVSEFIETTYDFTEDAGAQGDFVMTAATGDDLLVKLVGVKAVVAPTSAGSALLTVESDETADIFLNSEPIATFTLASFTIPENATTAGTAGFVKVSATKKLQFSIEAADLTAGELVFLWEVKKF